MEEVAKKRPIISARERGPGPARYALPPTVGYINHDFTKPTSPAYSFHTRLSSIMISEDSSPGPRYHVDAKVTRFGRMDTPSYSILGRGRHYLSHSPGPGSYSPEKAPPLNAHRRPPSHTIGARTRYRSVDAVPAPNSYTLPNLLGCQVPNKPSSASYNLAVPPAPAKYNIPNPDIYRQRQPSFSMQGRTKRPNYSSVIPGPGTYSPEKFYLHLPKSPGFSMGIRHTEFVTPLVVHIAD
uniref:Outer dense fiber of sperm tails 3-like 2a n=1 Tax=Monopterus albus TaxID=43700 RepID=A0A3Q3K026_MONAL